MSKSGRQLFQPESPLFWVFNVLLHMSEKEIMGQFDLTAGQLRALKLGEVPDSAVGKRMRRYLSHQVEELQVVRCRVGFIREYRNSFTRCLQSAIGFTVPRRKRVLWSKAQRNNRTEDAKQYLTQLLGEKKSMTKSVVKGFTRTAGFDWRMIRKAAVQLGIDTQKERWRLL